MPALRRARGSGGCQVIWSRTRAACKAALRKKRKPAAVAGRGCGDSTQPCGARTASTMKLGVGSPPQNCLTLKFLTATYYALVRPWMQMGGRWDYYLCLGAGGWEVVGEDE